MVASAVAWLILLALSAALAWPFYWLIRRFRAREPRGVAALAAAIVFTVSFAWGGLTIVADASAPNYGEPE